MILADTGPLVALFDPAGTALGTLTIEVEAGECTQRNRVLESVGAGELDLAVADDHLLGVETIVSSGGCRRLDDERLRRLCHRLLDGRQRQAQGRRNEPPGYRSCE